MGFPIYIILSHFIIPASHARFKFFFRIEVSYSDRVVMQSFEWRNKMFWRRFFSMGSSGVFKILTPCYIHFEPFFSFGGGGKASLPIGTQTCFSPMMIIQYSFNALLSQFKLYFDPRGLKSG